MALNAFATAGLWETSQPVVASFWQQVQALPTSASFLLSPEKTLALYSHVDPLTSALAIVLIVAFACWFMSVLSGNYSWVDRIWSIVPFVYCWHFAIQSVLQPAENPFGDVLPLFPPVQSSEVTKGIFDIAAGAAITRVLVFGWEVDARLALMALLTTLWGIRLTYNFFRKGGYEWSSEDYRWPVLRKLMPPGLFQIFNVVFIALYQNFLLFLLAAPAYVAWLVRDVSPLNWIDGVAAVGFLLCLLGETVADQQQWNFQTKKYELIRQQQQNRGSSSSAPVDAPQPSVVENGHGDYRRGFITHGLFRFSRHPNFFCEVTLWWTVYLFAVAATQGQLWVQWTALGAFLLTLLFQGSTTFTEKLSLQKYPEYALYQQSTSRLLPWFPGSSTPGEPAAVDSARKEQ